MSTCIGISIGIPFSRVLGGFTGLLDQYPNAAAAYSLRKLRNAYAGSAIRVRRSSDNAEQDIGFVSNVLDTASLLTFCGAGNGFIVTWYDQTTTGANLTETTGILQPQIVDSGVVINENTKPAIRSLGIGLNNNLFATLTVPQPLTIVAVLRTPLDRDQVPISGNLAVLRNYRRFATSNNFLIDAGSSVTAGSQNLNQTLDIVCYNGANSYFNLNGINVNNGNYGANSLQNLNLFNNQGTGLRAFETPIQEVIIFNYNISADINNIQTLINNYYAIY